MKKLFIPITAAAVLSSILLFSFSKGSSNSGTGVHVVKTTLTDQEKEDALKEFLIIQCLDKKTQWDGKVSIAYTNFSDNLTFKLTKTGIKCYEPGKDKPTFVHRETPVILSPQQSVQFEVTVPWLSEPKVAYALLEDAVVVRN